MSYHDNIVAFAAAEEGNNWAIHESRILQYFTSSTGLSYTKSQALTLSWCTFFVMWVLEQAKMDPMPAVGIPPPENFAIGRFIKSLNGSTTIGNAADGPAYWGVYDAFSVKLQQYTPQAGDLFYLPNHNNHVGIVEEVIGDAKIVTLNGNSGPLKGEGFDARLDSSGMLGGGFVYRTTRDLLDGNAMYNDACWIQTPD